MEACSTILQECVKGVQTEVSKIEQCE